MTTVNVASLSHTECTVRSASSNSLGMPSWKSWPAAHRRGEVEPFHEEAKGELGWDQYQGRLWPRFHRQGGGDAGLQLSGLVGSALAGRAAPPRRGHGRPPAAAPHH